MVRIGALKRSAPQNLQEKIYSPQTPNKITTVYHSMRKVCPDDVRKYAICVQTHHDNGLLEKGACASEFEKVKECFRNVRYSR
mmetsp:Transcript_10993/g.15466  ORF Transcript_10993/g.15466 Transcript_10993/m.15466 type:complete len:83 (-) Transcript_10993:566-814(-)